VDLLLQLGCDLERDVAERRRGQRRVEHLLVLGVGELEERQGTAVAEREEGVAVDPERPEQLVGLRPRGHQGQADELLVEGPRGFLVLGDEGVVVQPAR
jgi:hypothetical protein